MEGCLVSPGEVRDWGQVWTQLLWGVWEPVLLPWWVLGLRSWCQGSPVLWGGEDPAGNHLGKSQLPREGKAPDKRGRRCGVCVIPASKTLWWRFAPQARELGPISCFKVPLPSEISVIFKFINIYSSCIFIFWEGHVDTESSSPVPTPLCAIKLRSIFPKMSTQGSVSLGCLVSFAPGVALAVFNGFAWLSGTHLKGKMCLLASNLEDL